MLQRIPQFGESGVFRSRAAGPAGVPPTGGGGPGADQQRGSGPGQPLPSITELALEHGHARVTCGKAYRMLEAEGLVTRYPGLGYYVA